MTDYPGKELPKFWREIAAALVDCQGFGYEYAGRHPALIAPSGLRAQLPSTVTDGSRGHRLSYLTALKRIGAQFDRDWRPVDTRERTVTPFRQPPAVEEQIIAPWSDREWREMQRDSEHWWRQLFAPPEPAAEPAPEPVKPQLSTYGREFLARAAPRVRDDARGDGRYTLAQARQQLKDGDPLETVIERTGWGRMWLADLADRLAAS